MADFVDLGQLTPAEYEPSVQEEWSVDEIHDRIGNRIPYNWTQMYADQDLIKGRFVSYTRAGKFRIGGIVTTVRDDGGDNGKYVGLLNPTLKVRWCAQGEGTIFWIEDEWVSTANRKAAEERKDGMAGMDGMMGGGGDDGKSNSDQLDGGGIADEVLRNYMYPANTKVGRKNARYILYNRVGDGEVFVEKTVSAILEHMPEDVRPNATLVYKRIERGKAALPYGDHYFISKVSTDVASKIEDDYAAI